MHYTNCAIIDDWFKLSTVQFVISQLGLYMFQDSMLYLVAHPIMSSFCAWKYSRKALLHLDDNATDFFKFMWVLTFKQLKYMVCINKSIIRCAIMISNPVFCFAKLDSSTGGDIN